MKRKCNFRKSDGSRCGADAQSGKPLCVFHDPVKAAAGYMARRRGGINRHRPATVLPLETPDNPLRNTQDVSSLLGESINQVRKGQLEPRVANAMGYLASILLGALQQGPLEERLARLEAALELNDNKKVKAI
jgi:hypothetical protein